jgi:DNA polymerase-3 subunit delta'
MSHFPASLTASEPWKRLQSLAALDLFPHCISLSAPENIHGMLAREIAEMILCLNRTGGDDCTACRAWSGEDHPDLVRGGEPGKAPAIDACREVIRAMAYRPVVSHKRCAVIFSAERMLLPAANSLLKLAEEPPVHGVVFFLVSEEERLLPTLKSRAWTVSLRDGKKTEKKPVPSSPEEWGRWVEKNSGSEIDDVLPQFEPWIRHLVESGDHEGAEKAERLRILLESRRLSRTMALDLTVLALKEGIVFEHLFGDFW